MLQKTLVAEIAEKVELEGMTEDYGKLEKELEKASPLAIINEALQKFIDCSAISFSGAKDVSLILQSGVFSLETGRWSSQNYKLSDDLERFYGMDIEYLHQECCRVLEVRRLGRCCQGNTRPAFPWQHERGGRRWWEEGKVMERGLHKGNIDSEDAQISEHMNGAVSFTDANDPIADVLSSQNLTSLSRAGAEIVGTFKNRTGPWLDVLYAPWRHFFQAMENSYAKLVNAEVKTGKFRVDGEHRAFANQKLQLRIFTTTLIFPGSKPIKYSSEKRDVDSQLAFVSSLQW
ncbi:5'-ADENYLYLSULFATE REDUCTASE 3 CHLOROPLASTIC [Salix viminalis]|uniref:5'-ADENYLYLSULFATE REDUCTASE 3 CHLOROPLASTIC n=1 Tax=Salix viminalis TaxID=40686 RepID=A0A9Q0NRN7_SALVM|nr:5'-ADENYLYLSULFATE REDUCTASE 3 CHLOROPLASTIC [Salix viminalis]